MAVFPTYPSTLEMGFSMVLLGLSPLEDERDLGAQEHFNYVAFVLSLFDKSFASVVCLIGDNCSTNKVFAWLS